MSCLMFSQPLIMSSLSMKFSKAGNLFDILIQPFIQFNQPYTGWAKSRYTVIYILYNEYLLLAHHVCDSGHVKHNITYLT